MFWFFIAACPGTQACSAWEESKPLIDGRPNGGFGAVYWVQLPFAGGRTSRLSVQIAWKTGAPVGAVLKLHVDPLRTNGTAGAVSR